MALVEHGVIVLCVVQVDYFERAKRLVELALLEQHYEEQRLADREFHIERENQMVSTKWNHTCFYLYLVCADCCSYQGTGGGGRG